MTLNFVFKALLIVAMRTGSGFFSSLIIFFINRTASAPLKVGVALIGFAIMGKKTGFDLKVSEGGNTLAF